MTTRYCALLYCTVLYCTVLYCALLYCTVLYCTVLYCTVLYCTVLYCTVLYCTVLCSTVLYCTVLYCTVLYCTVLYCTVLYCTGHHAACNVGLKPSDHWDRGFKSRWGHLYSSLMFVVCCVGSGLCDGLIALSEESCRVRACVLACARARLCVI